MTNEDIYILENDLYILLVRENPLPPYYFKREKGEKWNNTLTQYETFNTLTELSTRVDELFGDGYYNNNPIQ